MKHILSIILDKRFYAPIIIFIVTTILYKIIKKIILNIFSRKSKIMDEKKHNTLRQLTTNIVKYFLYIIALLMILEVYNVDTKSLIASLGVFSLVVGLAVQDTLKDFISGITIILENQFEVGDNVTISGFRGDVIYMGLKTTKIRAYTGEIMILSNSSFNKVINYNLNAPLIFLQIPFGYEERIEKIEEVLSKVLVELKKDKNVKRGELLGVESFEESCIKYSVSVECNVGTQFPVKRLLLKNIKIAFDEAGIVIPYKQLDVHIEK